MSLPDDASSSPEPQKRRDPLLTIGLVLICVPCCPLTGLLGAMFGAFAHRRLRGTNASPRLQRLALFVMLGGLVSSLIWLTVIDRFAKGQASDQQAMMAEVLMEMTNSAMAGRPGEAAAQFGTSGSTRPSVEAIEAFALSFSDYGELERVEVISAVPFGSWLSRRVETACIFRFEQDALLGSARFRYEMAPGTWSVDPVIVSLTIESDDGETVHLGEPTAAGETGPPPVP